MSFIREKSIDADGNVSFGKLITQLPKDYSDGVTKQSFKDATDINKIIKKHQINVTRSHIEQFPPEVYGEFHGVDLMGAIAQIDRAKDIFNELGSELRAEFDNDPIRFVKFAGHPDNNNKLRELLPQLAEPGRFFPNPVKRGAAGAAAATPPRSDAGDTPANGENSSQGDSGSGSGGSGEGDANSST